MTDIKKGKARLRISCPTGGHWDEDGQKFEITLVDGAAAVEFISVIISAEDLALALANRQVEANFTLQAAHLVGTKREVKSELVPDMERVLTPAEAVEPYEVDGWRACARDYNNHHLWVTREGQRYYRVGFVRHVDPETGEPVL